MTRSAWGLTASPEVDWRLAAACRGQPPRWWDLGDPGNDHAKSICRGCPVRLECMDDAAAYADTGVVRGGWECNVPKELVRCRWCSTPFLRTPAGPGRRVRTSYCTPAHTQMAFERARAVRSQ